MITAPRDIWGTNLFEIFVQELGAKRVCELLEVPPVRVRRWLKGTTPVPRMAVLALYWETQYGRSMVHEHQVNEIRLLYLRVHLLEEQFRKAKDIVTGLRKLHTGTANEPYFEDLGDLHSYDKFAPNQWGTVPYVAPTYRAAVSG